MVFWAIVVILTLLALTFVLRPLLLGGVRGTVRAEYDAQIYRDQLAEIDADLVRGVLNEGEAQASRAEVSRRLLAAAAEAERSAADGTAPGGLSRAVSLGVVAAGFAAVFGAYVTLGAPGLPDQPLASRDLGAQFAQAQRPDQTTAELAAAAEPGATDEPTGPQADQYRELVAQLESVLGERPDDARGHQLLAQAYLRLNRRIAAREAQEEVLRITGAGASAEDYAALAEYMILAANGYVSPEAEAILTQALTQDPQDIIARYYSGLSLAQNGALDVAEEVWTSLLIGLSEDNPMAGSVRWGLERLRAARPTGLPGPTAEDIEAAEDASPEEQQAMIEGMVARLSDRLATEGGTPDEWARLIRAQAVLGRTEQATAIWQEARNAFAASPPSVALVDGVAAEMGLEAPEE